jgi:hypothetical protein
MNECTLLMPIHQALFQKGDIVKLAGAYLNEVVLHTQSILCYGTNSNVYISTSLYNGNKIELILLRQFYQI